MPTRDDLEAERLRVRIHRRMTGEERLRIAARMYDEGIELVRASILAREPDLDEAELRHRIQERVLGRELAQLARRERERRARLKEERS